MDSPRLFCNNLPLGGPPGPPPDPNAAPKAAIADVMWDNGSTLQVGFLDGHGDPWCERLHQSVRQVAPEWSRYANIRFNFRPNPGFGDISITFRQGSHSSQL